MTSAFRKPLFRYSILIIGAAGLAAVLFPGALRSLMRADQFMPHASCYLRNPKIIMLHVSSDLLIGFAYLSISTTLAYLVYKAREHIPFHWMFLAFGLFIITCGFTHFMEVWTVWQAVYWLAGAVKAICAVASVATAIALYPLLPKVFALVAGVQLSEERRLKLENANSELEGFAYSVAHDLRAPLRAMKGTATVLMEDHGPALDPEAQQHLARIADASQRMDRLICELLEYSRISRIVPELRSVDLESVLAEAQHALCADIEKNRAEIIIERPLPPAIANQTLLTQVLTNLVGNAVKFVAPGVQPRVRVFASKSDGVLRLSIEDNGIGIASAHRTKIFGLFQRLHSAAEYPGTGVGLALAEKAMSRMNGRLGFDSTPGQGSCFWIELPAG
ncbi:MAG: hypothetical protein C5B50_00240 [Verrucomicrobia bacterium]|nr:MAG: hypothetical protein C5B50_00240 [Verrucomicrobiota bacterium]